MLLLAANAHERIIAARPIRKVDDLLKIKGIAPIYMSAIRPHVKF